MGNLILNGAKVMNEMHIKEKADGTYEAELLYGDTKLIFTNVVVTPYLEEGEQSDEIEFTVSATKGGE